MVTKNLFSLSKVALKKVLSELNPVVEDGDLCRDKIYYSLDDIDW